MPNMLFSGEPLLTTPVWWAIIRAATTNDALGTNAARMATNTTSPKPARNPTGMPQKNNLIRLYIDNYECQ